MLAEEDIRCVAAKKIERRQEIVDDALIQGRQL